MKAIVLLLLSLFAFYVVDAQLCRGGNIFPATEVCPFPGGKSCCSPESQETIRTIIDSVLTSLPKKCGEFYRGLFCSGCDPLSIGYETMCRSFCEKFVKSCFEDLQNYLPDFGEQYCKELPETNCFRGFDFEPLPPRHICGQFGDPHIRLFSGQFKTCRALGKAEMFKSKDLTINAYNEEAAAGSTATVTKRLEVIYGGETLTFRVDNGIYPYPLSSDITYFNYFGGVTYHFPKIDTRLSVTISTNEIFFTLSTPDQGDSGKICKSGCPNDEINIASVISTMEKRNEAEEACVAAGIEKNSYHFKACVYDISVTDDLSYAESVAQYSLLEADAIAEEEYRKKSSSLPMIVNGFMLAIVALIALNF